jgi:hypothetical protein
VIRSHCSAVRIENIIIINIGNAYYQNPHFPRCSVDDPGRNVDHGAGKNLLLLSVKGHRSFSLQDVIEFSSTFVKVRSGSGDVYCVSPGRDSLVAFAD